MLIFRKLNVIDARVYIYHFVLYQIYFVTDSLRGTRDSLACMSEAPYE
jgi:hypothetical protein